MKYLQSFLMSLLFSFSTFAQDKIPIGEADYANNAVEMADTFRADGKIYVVVAVVMILLVGMFVYLFSMERQMKKLESEMKDAT